MHSNLFSASQATDAAAALLSNTNWLSNQPTTHPQERTEPRKLPKGLLVIKSVSYTVVRRSESVPFFLCNIYKCECGTACLVSCVAYLSLHKGNDYQNASSPHSLVCPPLQQHCSSHTQFDGSSILHKTEQLHTVCPFPFLYLPHWLLVNAACGFTCTACTMRHYPHTCSKRNMYPQLDATLVSGKRM